MRQLRIKLTNSDMSSGRILSSSNILLTYQKMIRQSKGRSSRNLLHESLSSKDDNLVNKNFPRRKTSCSSNSNLVRNQKIVGCLTADGALRYIAEDNASAEDKVDQLRYEFRS